MTEFGGSLITVALMPETARMDSNSRVILKNHYELKESNHSFTRLTQPSLCLKAIAAKSHTGTHISRNCLGEYPPYYWKQV
jgi:hypothetical protein